MPQLSTMEGLTGVTGFKAMGVHAGLKKTRLDVGLIVSEVPNTQAAAVFTRNAFAAAPVHISRQHVANGHIQAIVVNSGNANACTGRQGLRDAVSMAEIAGDTLGLDPEQLLVCSTGRIGIPMPMDKIEAGIRSCGAQLDDAMGTEISQAILTTDTGPKESRTTFKIAGIEYTLAGIGKGAGMIHPNMATMLAFMVTDAPIPAKSLRQALRTATDVSFNQISVDGDESTNDTAVLMANGAAGGDPIVPGTAGWEVFQSAVTKVSQDLAKRIAGDGEGATRLIHVHVVGAPSDTAARTASRAVAASNLVKAAIHGSDPNWGRIVAAIGQTTHGFEPDDVSIDVANKLQRVPVLIDGEPVEDTGLASEVLTAPEVYIHIDLAAGKASGTAWGCDLTPEYVTFNSAYTT